MTRPSLALAAAAFAVCAAGSVRAQLSGAIYTSNHKGDVVNGNVFQSKSKVYLNGGPGPGAPCSASGLPDGEYYFQVTDPSGRALLSTSFPIDERKVNVTNGVIDDYLGTVHDDKPNGNCGSTIVGLDPFLDSPNGGEEYKVWLTPVERYDVTQGFHGFLARYSKTDNFKIRGPGKPVAQTIVSGFKFYDFNFNQVWDPGVPQEVPVPGWKILLTANGVTTETFTDVDGSYRGIFDEGTVVTVTEVPPPPGFVPALGAVWEASTPISASVTATGSFTAGPDFGNVSFTALVGVGRTRGFWQGPNGEAVLAQNFPTWAHVLNDLPAIPPCSPIGSTAVSLRNNDGTVFTVPTAGGHPVAFQALDGFLQGDPALGFAAFLLSVHLGPAILNHEVGFMQGRIRVDRFQNGGLVLFEDLQEGAICLLQNPLSAMSGPGATGAARAHRDALLGCYKEFESINEEGTTGSRPVVFGISEGGEEFDSPY